MDRNWVRACLWLLGMMLLLASCSGSGSDQVEFRLGRVKRGDLTVAIEATGTVQPEEVIDVGAQVAGRIVAFGRDAKGRVVDYGSLVEEGTVLARIDDALYAAEVDKAEAAAAQARAALTLALAQQEQARVRAERASRDRERAETLADGSAISLSDLDRYRADDAEAQADLGVAAARVEEAEAKIKEALATLARARQNLSYCTITSPVRGVVIDRRVNIGQTVVASLNAPSLFLIAKDLTRIQVWVAVNEADIGRIKPGLPVEFTVDSFPGRTFQGRVNKIRLNAAMTQNVVTYTVEVATDNPDGLLLPYLTANVRFILDRRPAVLQVPNGALRFSPREEWIAKNVTRPDGPAVWVLDKGRLRPLAVTLGLSDGRFTEISGQGLEPGMEVVVGARSSRGRDGGANPFTPRFWGRKAKGRSE